MIALNPQDERNLFKDIGKLKATRRLHGKGILFSIFRLLFLTRKIVKELKSFNNRTFNVIAKIKDPHFKVTEGMYLDAKELLSSLKEMEFDEKDLLIYKKTARRQYDKLLKSSYELEKLARIKYYRSNRQTQTTV
jgi:hypothetical protein